MIAELEKKTDLEKSETDNPVKSKVKVPLGRGVRLIHSPDFNKGTAFTKRERELLGLRGLLPPISISQDLQADRIMENLRKKKDDLEKYIYMVSLQDRNENLFYYVLRRHLEELMPIIYTPTVGQACESFGHIYRRPRGLYISIEDKGHIKELFLNWPHKDVKVIVVTDGGRILGLGDLGVNGMGIPIGKLALYTACAGIDPTTCLPITIDVGTNNKALLDDPLYLGHKHTRTTGDEYFEFFDEFVSVVQDLFPEAIIQFEDFSTSNAFALLNRYEEKARVFNDDIQGTSSVALAGMLSAVRMKNSTLSEEKILYLGAGEAGIGIGNMICHAMEEEGLSEKEAKERNWFMDSRGLVCASRDDLAVHKQAYAHDHEFIDSFIKAIEVLKPTAIIGVSGQPGKFTDKVIKLMSVLNERPIVFALSNPTSKSECTAEQAYKHSKGKAIFASGSPFDPVDYNGRRIVPGQGNNVYIFPGVGLGLAYCHPRVVTERMFYEAAKVVSQAVTEEELNAGTVYPSFKRIRDVSVEIAKAILMISVEDGLVSGYYLSNMEENIRASMYEPDYAEYL
ncbi:MAG: NAD-dependent malic enzyme [Saprospiraceae bacterium]|nr:NAD-dependent malic enzyme [Bacteroidia bacterium]NNF21303.1 NAD-dependent malic enzyme [Saprospiraceae bacterium]